jgi:hypothetical protein
MEFTPGEYHHGHVAKGRIGAHLAQNSEARHIGQPKIEYHVITGLPPQRREGFGAGAGRDDLDIAMAKQFGHAKLFRSVVLDDYQPLAAPFAYCSMRTKAACRLSIVAGFNVNGWTQDNGTAPARPAK